MAKNAGGASRKGAVTNRKQYQEDGAWVKVDGAGNRIAIKQTPGAWKGIRKINKRTEAGT